MSGGSEGSHDKPKKKSHGHGHGDHGGGGHEEGHGEEWLISYADLMTLLVGFFVILLSFANVDEEKMAEAAQSVTKEFGGAYVSPYAELTEQIKGQVEKLGMGDQITVKTKPNGVEIAFLGTAFFESGSADFKGEARDLFDKFIPTIKEQNQKFDITIEGHTDDVPLSHTGFIKNNFELSSLRACRVLDYFKQLGFDEKTLTAIGYGETRPIAPNRDENGVAIPQNQAQNRRVVIKLTAEKKASL